MSHTALLKQMTGKSYPVISHGRGVFLYDTDGRRYLDGAGGAMTASIGHGVPEIAAAVADQLSRVAFTYRTQFTNEPAEQLANRMTSLAPGDLNTAFFVSSGSEATEFAMRAAVGHWQRKGHPDKVKVLSRDISYHGMTLGALSMSGHATRRPDFGSLVHPFPVGPPAHAYRFARPGETEEEYAERAAADFETAIVAAGPESVAAIIVEPIVGAAGGALVPPRGYLRRLRSICDRLGVLLIADEVITGMGRTGDWFASSHERVVPDMLALGKGLSAGYTPMAGVLLREHMVEAMPEGTTAPFGHTFSGNPLGAATCLAVLDYLEDRDVLANVRSRGQQLAAGLQRLVDRFPFMADVRGRGLLWGFEIVTDAATRTAPAADVEVSSVLVQECFQRGLIIYPAGIAPLNNAVLLAPPLTITAEEVDLLVALLSEALEALGHIPALQHNAVSPAVHR